MPVIVNSQNIHPDLPSLGSLSAIEETRAAAQDIRPLEILIINLMAKKRTTERQLAAWLGHSPLQVRLTFAATDSYVEAVRAGRVPANSSADHVLNFYKGWSEVASKKFDGLIVTGVNALQERVEQEAIWPEVSQIFAWSRENVFSSLFLCWGAKAALKFFHSVDSRLFPEKLWGVFPHTTLSDQTGLTYGLPDLYDLPVSRWKGPLREDLEACPALEIVAAAPEVGPNLLVEAEARGAGFRPFPRRVFLLAHPEYETGDLQAEYERDQAGQTAPRVPAHYFIDDVPAKGARNSWRAAGFIYTNWIHALYEAAPFDPARIPEAYPF